MTRSMGPSVWPTASPLCVSNAGLISSSVKSSTLPVLSRCASARKKPSCMRSNMPRQRTLLLRSACSVRWRSMASAAVRVTSAIASMSSRVGRRGWR
ncbi:Uncharacterised protein [Bordetella pertussis]|nr:Uncharacterised protein [Bordetella pertussis]